MTASLSLRDHVQDLGYLERLIEIEAVAVDDGDGLGNGRVPLVAGKAAFEADAFRFTGCIIDELRPLNELRPIVFGLRPLRFPQRDRLDDIALFLGPLQGNIPVPFLLRYWPLLFRLEDPAQFVELGLNTLLLFFERGYDFPTDPNTAVQSGQGSAGKGNGVIPESGAGCDFFFESTFPRRHGPIGGKAAAQISPLRSREEVFAVEVTRRSG